MRIALLQGLVNGLALSILALSPLIYREAHETGQEVRCRESCSAFYLDMK